LLFLLVSSLLGCVKSEARDTTWAFEQVKKLTSKAQHKMQRKQRRQAQPARYNESRKRPLYGLCAGIKPPRPPPVFGTGWTCSDFPRVLRRGRSSEFPGLYRLFVREEGRSNSGPSPPSQKMFPRRSHKPSRRMVPERHDTPD